MREIKFYKSNSGNCPVDDFLDSLSDKHVSKILWVLKLLKEIENIPGEYFKKMINTDGIWEVRAKSGSNSFRLFGFFDTNHFFILTNGFSKKSQKTPKGEIKLAQQRRKDYLERK